MFVTGLAFPNDKYPESSTSQRLRLLSIPDDISRKFCQPEWPIALRRRRSNTAFVSMPKASIDEYGPFSRFVRQIRRAGQRANIAAKSDLQATQHRRNLIFCLRPLLPDSTHQLGARPISRRLVAQPLHSAASSMRLPAANSSSDRTCAK